MLMMICLEKACKKKQNQNEYEIKRWNQNKGAGKMLQNETEDDEGDNTQKMDA